MVLMLIFLVMLLLCSATGGETCLSGKQESYRGTKATTINGRTCQVWSSQTPHSHSRTPEKYDCLLLVSQVGYPLFMSSHYLYPAYLNLVTLILVWWLTIVGTRIEKQLPGVTLWILVQDGRSVEFCYVH